jgi:hypothetical protein|tara:strand:- start:109 stop:357 length:249 start_codon:yes stop_codon:yes gene_type:complete
MKQSTALIRLTKSEIESVIIALQFTEDSSEFFESKASHYGKIKNDFIKIKKDIRRGERNIETENKTEEENRTGKGTCKACSD